MATAPRPIHTKAEHISIGVLEQRVYGTEVAIKELSNQTVTLVGGLRQDTHSQIVALSSQISSLAEKLDTQQSYAIQASRVNWLAVMGTVAAVVTVCLTTVGMIGVLAKAPIDAELIRLSGGLDHIMQISIKRGEYEVNTKRMDDRITANQESNRR